MATPAASQPPHSSSPAGHAAPPAPMPHVPPVVDEAANTPMWVPLIGLLLLALGGLWMVYRVATAEEEADPAAAIVPEGEGAEGEAAAGAEGAPAKAPAPVAAVPPPMPVPTPAPMPPPMPPPGAAPQGH